MSSSPSVTAAHNMPLGNSTTTVSAAEYSVSGIIPMGSPPRLSGLTGTMYWATGSITTRSGAPQVMYETSSGPAPSGDGGEWMQMSAVMYETSAKLVRKKACRPFATISGVMDRASRRFASTIWRRKAWAAIITSAAFVPWPWMSPSTKSFLSPGSEIAS